MRITRHRAIAAATAVAIALTSTAITPATAGSYRHYNHARGNQAFAGVLLGIIGAVGAYAAAREYRKAQEHRYYRSPAEYGYSGDPGYEPPPPGYYR